MIAQPAVHVPGGFALDGSDPSPVARAIVAGLATARRAGHASPAQEPGRAPGWRRHTAAFNPLPDKNVVERVLERFGHRAPPEAVR
jgi:hypothetical protein